MNWDKVNRWSTVLSNVALVGGLLLVAVQIRQNTAITRAQLVNDYFLADMELELAMMGEDPAASFTKAVFDPGTLNEYDAAVLDRYFNYGLVQVSRLRQMDELGLADEGWEERIRYLRWHLGNEAGRRWWGQIRADGSGDEFVAAIDSILLNSDWNDNRDLIEAIVTPDSEQAR